MKTPPKAWRARSFLLNGLRRGLRTALLGALLTLGAGAAGCASGETGFIEREMYPANKKQTRSLDIQVFREDTMIRFTNSTAHSIPACTMWINAWFSLPIDAVAIGETVELNLFDFKDQYGDTFRAGGFFATEKPTSIVLAQLEMPDEFLGLVVIGEFE